MIFTSILLSDLSDSDRRQLWISYLSSVLYLPLVHLKPLTCKRLIEVRSSNRILFQSIDVHVRKTFLISFVLRISLRVNTAQYRLYPKHHDLADFRWSSDSKRRTLKYSAYTFRKVSRKYKTLNIIRILAQSDSRWI